MPGITSGQVSWEMAPQCHRVCNSSQRTQSKVGLIAWCNCVADETLPAGRSRSSKGKHGTGASESSAYGVSRSSSAGEVGAVAAKQAMIHVRSDDYDNLETQLRR